MQIGTLEEYSIANYTHSSVSDQLDDPLPSSSLFLFLTDPADLSAFGSRLAAQEEALQAQLSAQLENMNVNRGSNSGAGGRGPGGLPSLGENTVEDGSSNSPSQQNNRPFNRAGGPRFAGNAAFQSAVARHGGNANNSPNQSAAQSHARQLSLQGRFAELGYGTSSMPMPHPYDNDNDADDAASSVTTEFMGGSAFDPTRSGNSRDSGLDPQQIQQQVQMQLALQQQQQQQQRFGGSPQQQYGGNVGGLPHRRTGSDMSAMQIMQLQQQGMGGNGASQLIAEQMALQQQIEVSCRKKDNEG